MGVFIYAAPVSRLRFAVNCSEFAVSRGLIAVERSILRKMATLTLR